MGQYLVRVHNAGTGAYTCAVWALWREVEEKAPSEGKKVLSFGFQCFATSEIMWHLQSPVEGFLFSKHKYRLCDSNSEGRSPRLE